MNLAGTETRPYPLSRGRADYGEVDIALDPVPRIDKVVERKGWQDRTDDPFAESEPALAELWKAAPGRCRRPPRRFLSRAIRSPAAVTTPPTDPRPAPLQPRQRSGPRRGGGATKRRHRREQIAAISDHAPPSTGGRSATGRR